MRGGALKYPDRKRCMRCRSYFGFLIVDGLYDSYECAGRPKPQDVVPEDWPREHFSWRPKHEVLLGREARKPKQAWLEERKAERAAKKHHKEHYLCNFCQQWHIGSSRKQANIA